MRTEQGKQFRRAFVPAEGCTFLVADYDQVELRCIAHLSEDPGLIDALTTGSDVHRTVAAAVYGIAPEEVNHTQREYSKMVSYGLAYGMEAYGLSQRLGVPVEEAAAIMESYFGAFPLVKQYMDHAVADAKIRGADPHPVRPHPARCPTCASANYRVRQAAERQAMNAGIQGLAADIFKLALVRLDRDLEAEQLASRLVLQVHDEVIVEVAAGRRKPMLPPHRVRPDRGGRPQGPPRRSPWPRDRAGPPPRAERRRSAAEPGKNAPEQLLRWPGLARRHRWRRKPYFSN